MKFKNILLALLVCAPLSPLKADDYNPFLVAGGIITAICAATYEALIHQDEIKKFAHDGAEAASNMANNTAKKAVVFAGEKYINRQLLEKAKSGAALSSIEKKELAQQMNLLKTACYHNAQTADLETARKLTDYGNQLHQAQALLAIEMDKAPLREFFVSCLKGVGTGCHYLAGNQALYSSKFNQKCAEFLHTLGNNSYTCSKAILEHKGIMAKPLDAIDLNNNVHFVCTIAAATLTTYATYKIINKCVYRPAKNAGKNCISYLLNSKKSTASDQDKDAKSKDSRDLKNQRLIDRIGNSIKQNTHAFIKFVY